MKRGRGFTLVEVLTTITIIGILVALSSAVYSSALKRSRDGQRKTDLDTIKNAVEQYYLDNRNYPSYNSASGAIYIARWQLESRQTTGCLSTRSILAPTYIATLPEDPLFRLPTSVTNCGDLEGEAAKGMYLYFVAGNTDPKNIDTRPKAGYYLFGRMETSKQVNFVAIDRTTVSDWGYDLGGLVFGNSINPSVTHNYRAKWSPNN